MSTHRSSLGLAAVTLAMSIVVYQMQIPGALAASVSFDVEISDVNKYVACYNGFTCYNNGRLHWGEDTYMDDPAIGNITILLCSCICYQEFTGPHCQYRVGNVSDEMLQFSILRNFLQGKAARHQKEMAAMEKLEAYPLDPPNVFDVDRCSVDYSCEHNGELYTMYFKNAYRLDYYCLCDCPPGFSGTRCQSLRGEPIVSEHINTDELVANGDVAT